MEINCFTWAVDNNNFLAFRVGWVARDFPWFATTEEEKPGFVICHYFRKKTEDNCPTRGKKPPNKPSAMQLDMMRRCRGKKTFLDRLSSCLYIVKTANWNQVCKRHHVDDLRLIADQSLSWQPRTWTHSHGDEICSTSYSLWSGRGQMESCWCRYQWTFSLVHNHY